MQPDVQVGALRPALEFNHLPGNCGNLATIGGDFATVYDDFGDHVAVLSKNEATDTKGGDLTANAGSILGYTAHEFGDATLGGRR